MKNKLFFCALFITISYRSIAQQVFPLYPDSIPGSILKLEEDDQPTFQVFRPQKMVKNGTSVIIFPGGAYTFLAYAEEGTVIAKAFAKKGIVAFVVKYRLPKKEAMRDKSFGPLMDAQQAIKVIRKNASTWHINPEKIGVIGYSAGGHLASTLGTHFTENLIPNKENISLRPDFMILFYPVISMRDHLTHTGSKISLIGVEPSEGLVHFFSNEENVSKNCPPTYITHCGDDSLVDVNNSIVFYQSLQKNGVDAELHLFPKGNHGFTQRMPDNEWMDPVLKFLNREGLIDRNYSYK